MRPLKADEPVTSLALAAADPSPGPHSGRAVAFLAAWWKHRPSADWQEGERLGCLARANVGDDPIDRPQRRQINRQACLDLQLDEPVSDDVNDLVRVRHIDRCHEVDALGVEPFLDREARLRKALGDEPLELVQRRLQARGDPCLVLGCHRTIPPHSQTV